MVLLLTGWACDMCDGRVSAPQKSETPAKSTWGTGLVIPSGPLPLGQPGKVLSSANPGPVVPNPAKTWFANAISSTPPPHQQGPSSRVEFIDWRNGVPPMAVLTIGPSNNPKDTTLLKDMEVWLSARQGKVGWMILVKDFDLKTGRVALQFDVAVEWSGTTYRGPFENSPTTVSDQGFSPRVTDFFRDNKGKHFYWFGELNWITIPAAYYAPIQPVYQAGSFGPVGHSNGGPILNPAPIQPIATPPGFPPGTLTVAPVPNGTPVPINPGVFPQGGTITNSASRNITGTGWIHNQPVGQWPQTLGYLDGSLQGQVLPLHSFVSAGKLRTELESLLSVQPVGPGLYPNVGLHLHFSHNGSYILVYIRGAIHEAALNVYQELDLKSIRQTPSLTVTGSDIQSVENYISLNPGTTRDIIWLA